MCLKNTAWIQYVYVWRQYSCSVEPLYLRWEWAINLSTIMCMFFRFLGQKSSRRALFWINTGDGRHIQRGWFNFDINEPSWCVRVCVPASQTHLYEDSTLLRCRCLKIQRCHGMQTEWRVSTSPQSEETCPQSWHSTFCVAPTSTFMGWLIIRV